MHAHDVAVVIRDVVGIHLVEHPESFLCRRERDAVRPNTGRDVGGRPGQFGARGDVGGSPRLEEVADGQFGAEFGAQCGDESHRRHGVTAQCEEVVVDTDRASLVGGREAEDLGEDLAEPSFELGAWRASRTADLGDRQRLHVELAVDSHRELGDRGEQGRDHVVGEARAQLTSQLRVVELRARVGGNHVRHQTFDIGCCRIGGRHDCRRRDLWQRGHRGIDLGELDPIAADLDLVVGASEEVEVSVGTDLHRVSGAIQAASVGERIRDKPLGRQIGPSEVSACQSRAADVQLARYPGGHRPQPRVEQVRGGVPDWSTD